MYNVCVMYFLKYTYNSRVYLEIKDQTSIRVRWLHLRWLYRDSYQPLFSLFLYIAYTMLHQKSMSAFNRFKFFYLPARSLGSRLIAFWNPGFARDRAHCNHARVDRDRFQWSGKKKCCIFLSLFCQVTLCICVRMWTENCDAESLCRRIKTVLSVKIAIVTKCNAFAKAGIR